MAVPDYQSFMLPLLKLADDNEEHTLHEAFDALAKQFNLSSEDRNELLPSGQRRFENRVGWARTCLKKAGLLESPVRSVFRITPRGKEVLKSGPANINAKYLKRFPEFVEFQRASHRNGETEKEDEATSTQTPEEIAAQALVDAGVSLEKLDAGYKWDGWMLYDLSMARRA